MACLVSNRNNNKNTNNIGESEELRTGESKELRTGESEELRTGTIKKLEKKSSGSNDRRENMNG